MSGINEPLIEAKIQQQDVYTEIMQLLVDRLTTIKPKYGAIFRDLLKGNIQLLTIISLPHSGLSGTYWLAQLLRFLESVHPYS